MTVQRQRTGAILEPLDVLFFRDGRPFAAAMRGSSGLPLPQTTAGAIWARLCLETLSCCQAEISANEGDDDHGQEVAGRLLEPGEHPP